MQRISFSSPGAEAGREEAARFRQWWDAYRASLAGVEVSLDPAMPFATNVEFMRVGGVFVGRCDGSFNRFERGRKGYSRDGDDCFHLSINRGVGKAEAGGPTWRSIAPPGHAVLQDFAEAADYRYHGGDAVECLHLPRRQFLEAVRGAEDLSGVVISGDNEALRLLKHFMDGLRAAGPLSHPAVLAHAGQTLTDLTALALGVSRDYAEVARSRGLRAARLDAVLGLIRAEYADPELSPAGVAARVGISQRYLHKLLQETGASFAERVQELRLEKAFRLLSGEAGSSHKVHQAAYDSGFNDLSHFNRVFRRRYGLTPTAARGRGR